MPLRWFLAKNKMFWGLGEDEEAIPFRLVDVLAFQSHEHGGLSSTAIDRLGDIRHGIYTHVANGIIPSFGLEISGRFLKNQ